MNNDLIYFSFFTADESSQEQSVNNTGIVEEVASKSVSKTNPSNNGNNSTGEHSGDSSSESEVEAMDNNQTRALDENESSEQSSESVADDSLMAVQSEEGKCSKVLLLIMNHFIVKSHFD